MKVIMSIFGEIADVLEGLNSHPEVRLLIPFGREKLETEGVGRVVNAKVVNRKGLITDIEVEVEINGTQRTEEE